MVKRSSCVFNRVTQRHLYSTFELQVININALDVKSPQIASASFKKKEFLLSKAVMWILWRQFDRNYVT